jgi:multisubunit Na+/H+ antiporter MnhB subunit
VARLLLLPTLMVAIATLVKGYSETGDGFSAGVIAAVAILLQYLVFGRRAVRHVLPAAVAPVAVLFGLLVALLVAFVPTVLGESVLTHMPPPGRDVISLGTLAVHTAVLFDVAIFGLVFGFVVGVLDRFGAAAEEPRA